MDKEPIDYVALLNGGGPQDFGHEDFEAVTDIVMRPPKWYWRHRIVADELNVLAGVQGTGKSQVAVALAADATRRGETVLWISAEESSETTIKPRFVAAGGIQRGEGGEPLLYIWKQGRPWQLEDVKKLDTYITTHEASLVVIDPIVAFAGGKDSHRDSEVRQLLAPVTAVAQKRGATIVSIMHLKKGQEAEVVNSIGGSVAWTAVPRSVLVLRRSDDEVNRNERVLWHAKCNVGAEQPALLCAVEPTVLTAPDGEVIETAFIKWKDERPDLDIRAAFSVPSSVPGSDGRSNPSTPALDKAVEVLKELLADGPMPKPEFDSRVEAAGVKPKTLKKARALLGVESKLPEGGSQNGVWMVVWPAADRARAL